MATCAKIKMRGPANANQSFSTACHVYSICHDYAPFPLSPYPTLFVSTKPIFKTDHEHAAKIARHAPSHQYL